MNRMKSTIPVIIVAAALASSSCAQVPAAAPFSKSDWKVTRVTCPAGCAEQTLRFLQSQMGRKVQLSATMLEAPFLDKCDGKVRWQLHDGSAATVVGEVNRGAAPEGRRVRSADLGDIAPEAIVTSGVALCDGRYGELPMARVLLLEPDRLVILFEQQSFIELR